MAITNEESQAAYETLATLTREANLLWVVSQVEDKVSVGKVSLKKVSARGYPALYRTWPGEEGQSRRPPSALFVASEEYSPRERLRVLAEALMAAVPAVHDVASTSLNTLKSIGDVDGLRFVPEAAVKESFEIDSSILERAGESIARLRTLLEELLQEIADGTSSTPPR
jgi:hypothetical protein